MENWVNLAVLSVRNPAEAARRVIALDLSRDTLWIAIALVSVLNTLVFSLSNMALPVPLPPVMTAPAIYFLMSAGSLVLAIIALFWTGRALGGQGSMTDVMSVVVWLQVLRLIVQAFSFVLIIVAPGVSALFVMIAGLIGLWIMLHFVNEAHRFGSLWRAFGVLIAAFLAIVMGLSLVLSLIGVGGM